MDTDHMSNQELLDLVRKRNAQEMERRIAQRRCFRCGKTQDENGFLPLTDISIMVAEGEEGHSDLRRYMCEEHLGEVTEALVEIGLGVHVHGGICYLEFTNCPGHRDMSKCPSPEDQYPQETT